MNCIIGEVPNISFLEKGYNGVQLTAIISAWVPEYCPYNVDQLNKHELHELHDLQKGTLSCSTSGLPYLICIYREFIFLN
jgi:hypothetical protein